MILVSACLLGMITAYDARSNLAPGLVVLAARGELVPVCPEVAGGLPTPRPPAEIVGGSGEDVLDGRARVLTVDGADVTAAFVAGAGAALAAAQRCGATLAILKAHSPSCGSCTVYDGTFSGRIVPGAGVATALLRRSGIEVVSDEDWSPHSE